MSLSSYFNDATTSPGLINVIYKSLGMNTAAQNNSFNAQQAQLTRDFNSAEAEKQRAFEERMANTQYQRAIADMQAAGLNTALAYSQGGNSVPSGASASGGSSAHAAASGNLVGLLGGIIGSLTSVAKSAIQSNSARAVADVYANSRANVADINAASRKSVADIFAASRRSNRPDIEDVTYYRDKYGDYHKYTQHLYRD